MQYPASHKRQNHPPCASLPPKKQPPQLTPTVIACSNPMLPSYIEQQFRSRHGGKRAWLRHLSSLLALRSGRLDRFRRIDCDIVQRVVFVCKGNICRSAYAHARAVQIGLRSDSFGLQADASSADPDASLNATKRGLDLGVHRPKAPHHLVLSKTDLVAAMEPEQAWHLAARFTHPQITLLGLWADPQRPYIHDPYGHDDEYFQTCFSIIDTAVNRMADAFPQSSCSNTAPS